MAAPMSGHVVEGGREQAFVVMGASLERSRDEVAALADEQGALRRVATLVARAAPPDEVFAAVPAELGRLLSGDHASLNRYDPDGAVTVLGDWNATGSAPVVPVGGRVPLGGRNVVTQVFETGQPARIDGYADAGGSAAEVAHAWGISTAVGVPITVEGRLWGVMIVFSTRAVPLPADTEARLAGFTELVGTAIANAQARLELRGFAQEQAALRRVATLVGRAAPPEEVFAAVTAELGGVLAADRAAMSRYDANGTATVVGTWSAAGSPMAIPVGLRMELGGRNLHTLVHESCRSARIDDYATATGPAADAARELGLRSAVGAPVTVQGRLWGFMSAMSTSEELLPADTETRLAGFTELVATAISNAEAQAALTASRARIVAAADTTRRRIERDLHDAAQQRLVSLALHLRSTVQAAVPPGSDELTAQLDEVAAELVRVVEDLRELAMGVHPAALVGGGLRSALRTLARRSAVPVRLDVDVKGRLPEPIELAAYDVVAEALRNAATHAQASVVDVRATVAVGVLEVRVSDDGRGGADPAGGSGLIGLTDRVEALGGRLTIDSPPGAGTAIEVVLPIT